MVVVYIDGNTKRQLTYADVRDQARTFGIGLKSLWGWQKGDVLAVFRFVTRTPIQISPTKHYCLYLSNTDPSSPLFFIKHEPNRHAACGMGNSVGQRRYYNGESELWSGGTFFPAEGLGGKGPGDVG